MPIQRRMNVVPLIGLLGLSACTGSVGPNEGAAGATKGTEGSAAAGSRGSGSTPAPDNGAAGGDAGTATEAKPGSPSALGAGGLRRLTVAQYKNAIKQLIGVTVQTELEPDTSHDGFVSVGATRLALSPNAVEKFESAALDVAHQAFADSAGRAKLAGCQPAGAEDAGCARSFVTTLGRRAWRRPLTDEEAKTYVAIAVDVGKQTKDPWLGLELALAGLLQSPNFLYRVELGRPDPSAATRLRLDDYEMATRLSFFLRDAPPTDDMLDLAASNKLGTAEAVEQQARRMLEDPSARDVLARFYAESLDVDGVEDLVKDTKTFPRMSSTLGASMGEEVRRSFLYFAFERPGNVLDVFETKETFVNAELASLYGLAKPAGAGFVKVAHPDAARRVGVLGQGAFLARHGHSDGTSVTQRGLAVRRMLCNEVPDPPPGVNTTLPPVPSGAKQTMRARMAEHAANATCATCHALFDPIGLSMEKFDGIGEFRKDDRGLEIDTSGTLDGMPFKDNADVAHLVRTSGDLAPCFVEQLFRFAAGRREASGEASLLTTLGQRLSSGSASLSDITVALATSDAFRYVSPPQ